jgi:hypothetical protein
MLLVSNTVNGRLRDQLFVKPVARLRYAERGLEAIVAQAVGTARANCECGINEGIGRLL